jgi:hypothetical protein
MLQDKKDVIFVRCLWTMKEIRVHVAIDSYDVYLEVEKEKKIILFK